MNKNLKIVLLIIPILLISFTVVQASVEDKINSIVYHAEQYEIGNINYLQLRVYAHSIREEIQRELGKEIKPYHRGLERGVVEEILGEPTEMVYWIWVENRREEKKLNEPMPTWRKIIFDGRKIQITFNAWPHIMETEDGDVKYYWVDFEVRFKKKLKFDLDSIIPEITSLATTFNTGQSNGRSLAEKMVKYERTLSEYIQQNKEKCIDILEDLFSSDEKKSEQKRIRWRLFLYEGDKLDLRLEVHMCGDCEWPWVNMWFDVDVRDPRFRGEIEKSWKISEEADREYYREWSIDGISDELKRTISDLINDAKDFDRAGSDEFPRKFGYYRSKLDAMNSMLDEKYYSNLDVEERNEKYNERISFLENFLDQYGDIEKTSLNEIRFEKRLIENTIERQDSWCRHLHDIECAEDEGCYQGKCVPALGGNEDCFNGEDDDNDNIVDCDDPDCYQEKMCGKICESICKDTCWSCIDEKCSSKCKECWECEKEGRDCRDICEDTCWKCNNEECGETCDECWDCEDENYGSGCREICKPCWKCGEEGRDCENECQECWVCEEEKRKEECKEKCGEDEACIEECVKKSEEDKEAIIEECKQVCMTKDQVIACIELCEQEVIFICQGKEQRTPCKDVEYICETGAQDIPCVIYTCPDGTKQTEPCELMYICDGKPQKTPCNVYICGGKESLVPCKEIIECGENQELKDNICVCIEGFYDCDEDGNCESTNPCKKGMEICDDGEDNNEDGLIDCQDMIECKGMICGQDENGNELRCFEDECLPTQGCANEGEMWGGDTTIWECCEGLTQLNVDEKSGYCTYCGDRVCKSPEDLLVNDQLLCSEDCRVQPAECVNDTDCDDNNLCTEDTCLDGGCSYEGITPCCGNRICEEGEDISSCENDCLQPCPTTCCFPDCPPGCPELCLEKCGNHVCEEGEEDTCPEDCTECPVYEPPDCPDGKIIFKGKDEKGCPLEPICVILEEEECETDEDCVGAALCGVAECIDNKCKVVDLTTCTDPECDTGETKTETCEDGSEIIIAECFDFRWTDTGVDCPEITVVCGDGVCSGDETSETCLEDCPEEVEEVTEEELEAEIEEFECTLVTDCKGPQDVCSNGKCVTLPISTEEEEEIPEVEEALPEEVEEEPEEIEETLPEEAEEEGPEEEPEEEPGETPEEEPTVPSGEFLRIITGFFTRGKKCEWDGDCPSDQFCTRHSDLREDIGEFFCTDKCSSEEDCPPRMYCDEVRGVCHCKKWEGYFDCDGKYENGCESDDATCDGTYNVCDYMDWCKKQPNKYCDPEKGDCVCKEGFYDCDGDWENGCESTHECKTCQSDEDCAEDRCAEWGNVIQQFGCYQGQKWIEEISVFRLGGGCVYTSEQLDHGYIHFDAWGDPFDKLNPLRHEFEKEMRSSWCEWELENLKKERKEIEEVMNVEFLEWFFEDYVTTSPKEWEKHIGGIWDVYWMIVNNIERTARSLQCSGEDWPSDYNKINIEYDTKYGSVKIWEEEKTTDRFGKPMKIFSPYMKIWVFPTKEFIKQEFKRAMEKGELPGPPEEEKGPSPADIEKMKQDEEFMKFIRKISDSYGGEAKIVVSIKEDEEVLYQVFVTINPDIIVDIRPTFDIPKQPNVTIILDFDFVYDMIMTEEKEIRGEEIEYPPWEERPRGGLREVGTRVKIFTKLIGAITTGKIKVSPTGEMLKIIGMMKDMMKIMSMGPSDLSQ